MASCVAVLSSTNCPLFVLSSSEASNLADHYSLHTSLDVIEEKTGSFLGSSAGSSPAGSSAAAAHQQAKRSGAEASRELYLGTLFATEKKKVFGYVTNTRVKFIIIVDASNTSLRDNEIRQMFRKLHTAYTQLLSNPFYIPGEKISSKKFEAIVKSLMVTK